MVAASRAKPRRPHCACWSRQFPSPFHRLLSPSITPAIDRLSSFHRLPSAVRHPPNTLWAIEAARRGLRPLASPIAHPPCLKQTRGTAANAQARFSSSVPLVRLLADYGRLRRSGGRAIDAAAAPCARSPTQSDQRFRKQPDIPQKTQHWRMNVVATFALNPGWEAHGKPRPRLRASQCCRLTPRCRATRANAAAMTQREPYRAIGGLPLFYGAAER
jgi:hypothetical protein